MSEVTFSTAQLAAIIAMAGAGGSSQVQQVQQSGYCPASAGFTSLVGKRMLIRGYASGVFFGTVVAVNGREVEMANARRLWSWEAAKGISLSAISVDGVKASGCRFPQPMERVVVTDALEYITVSATAAASIDAVPITEAR
jgi:hypothetical protein